MNMIELEHKSTRQLLGAFSVPCVISMLVAALYNIVDQVFIGWSEAGAYGNAATNIVYPFTVFALGLSLMIGDGTATSFSIALGKKDLESAGNVVGNGCVLLLAVSLIFCAVGALFQTPILALFGGDPAETLCYQYAVSYYRVICAGFPFYMIGQGLNGVIRADASPKLAMGCTLAGAITNLLLDPLFIFVWHKGVQGAAWATVLGQLVTFLLSGWALLHAKHRSLRRSALRLKGSIVRRTLSIGLASLIVQLSIVVIISVNNHLLVAYGHQTLASSGKPFGAVIPLAVLGIVMKVFGIVVSIVIGISLGGQPLIGYYLGAKQAVRVRETIALITKTVLAVGAAAFLLFECLPDAVIALFGTNNSPEYMEYARLCIRIFLGGIICTCLVKSWAVLLQSMGNSRSSTLLALLRDVILFVPASILLTVCSHSIVVMLYAALIADVLSAIAGGWMLKAELRRLYPLSNGRLQIHKNAESHPPTAG